MLCEHVTPEIYFWQAPLADIYGVSEIRSIHFKRVGADA